MKLLFCTLILSLSILATASAKSQPAIIFSQDVVAINADGTLLDQVKIDPAAMTGMRTLDFDLGRKRLLRIQTNLLDAESRGLSGLVATVRECYSYIETKSGRPLQRGVMLYLIELPQTPYAYTFRASYDDATLWSEVRLALIDSGAPLNGPLMPVSLSDLLYDTLPHELGHDVLGGIPQLMHDIDGDASNHTRWFIEGICEVLAKGFSDRETPDLHRYFLELRNVGSVLSGKEMRSGLIEWAQANDNNMATESDLYGAALLAMLTWTETTPLSQLLKGLTEHSGKLDGRELVAMMKRDTGLDLQELLSRADDRGRQLNKELLLARQGGATSGS